MNRRTFLQQSTIIGAAAATCWPATNCTAAAKPDKKIKITRVIGFVLRTRRSKIAGRNSRLDVHGDRSGDRMLWIKTDKGLDGLGACRANKTAAAKLLGKTLGELYDEKNQRMKGPLGAATMPLWDLLGKSLGQPVYKLLGGKGPDRVPIYDGSIYFADLLPRYTAKWQDRFKEEIDMGLKDGHRTFKIKIGRGAKWMKRPDGDRRDVEVVRLIRKHAGADVALGVDANNGYDLAGTKRFMDQAGPLKLAFTEEMFDETVEQCLDYKKYLAAKGWKTLLADGETQGKLEAFKPFIKNRAMDVLQADMKRFGIEGILTEAAWARPQGIQIAPHNWGSLLGYYMQLHVGRAIENFYMAEHDPLSTDVLIADGYERKDGTSSVPDKPGFGLALHKANFAAQIKPTFDLRAR